MRLLLIGPPGVGKGTQAKFLVDHFIIPQISSGDMLRNNIRNHTELGNEAQTYMQSGKLVPDTVILNMMEARLRNDDCSNGYILDGFPRTMIQAEKLSETLTDMNLAIDTVVNLEVNADEVINRLTGRSTCPDCGAMFHEESRPPKVQGVCDGCGGSLAQRQDDNKETILKRLEVYQESTAPLKEFYKKQGNLKTVTARGSVEEIFSRVCEMVQ